MDRFRLKNFKANQILCPISQYTNNECTEVESNFSITVRECSVLGAFLTVFFGQSGEPSTKRLEVGSKDARKLELRIIES